MRARRNLYLFVPYLIASQEGLAHGIYLVWMLAAKHLSAQTAAFTLAAGEVTIVVLQVPTGILADRFGRRGSLIAGSVTQVLGLLGFWFGEGALQLFGGALLIAVGDSFRSGADEALLYESCASLGRGQDYGRILAWARAATTVGMAALVALGGHLSRVYGMSAAWAGETALCALGLGMALLMVPVDDRPPLPDDPDDSGPLDLRLPGLGVMARVLLPATLCGAVLASGELFTQVDWPADLGIERLTWVISLAILCEALGALLATRFRQAGLMTALALAELAAAACWGAGPTAAFLALSLFEGWIKPLRSEQIQLQAADHHRAQAASWAGALDTALSVTLLPLAAVLQAQLGSNSAQAALAAALALAWGLLRLASRREAPGIRSID